MKILFLDCDGVLNSAQSAHFFHRERLKAKVGHPGFLDALGRRALREDEFCPIACSNLLLILEEVPDVKIVVSSTWRLGRTVEELRDVLAKAGVDRERIIDKTPVIWNEKRGTEIQTWLDTFDPAVFLQPKVTDFVIVDDDSDMLHLLPKLVQTKAEHGLMYKDAREIIRRFSGEIEPDID